MFIGARDSGPRNRALSAPRHCLDAYFKNDREKGVTRPHRAPVAQNRILGPENPKSVTSRSVTWRCLSLQALQKPVGQFFLALCRVSQSDSNVTFQGPTSESLLLGVKPWGPLVKRDSVI